MEYLGAHDNRTETEKASDYKWSEIYAMGSVTFPERPSFGFTPRNQDGSSSCVAQTTAKMLEVWDYKHDGLGSVFSATPIYKNRTNSPAPGMSFIDAFSYTSKNGSYLESDIPSQNMNEEAMDNANIKAISQPERPTAYLSMPVDFYAVAGEIDRSGAVMIWIKCSGEEWSTIVPTGSSDSEAIRHSICATDKIMWNNTEYLVIEDSWGKLVKNSDIPIQEGQRAISKQFFDKHCYFAGCFTKFTFEAVPKPQHTWTLPMKYGQTSNDIKMLQDVLKYEKLFPSSQESTGHWGGITAKAVQAWQVSHGILDFQNETDMTKIIAGKKSIALLNSIYG